MKKFMLIPVLIFCLSGCNTFKLVLNDAMIGTERCRAELNHGIIQINGHNLAYVERPGPGETIVLIHAFTTSKDIWMSFIRYMPREYRIIAIDMPGHGENIQDPEKLYSIEYMVESFGQAVDALKLERFHIAGNSMGGWISIIYTARNPGRVKSMLLIDNAGIFSSPHQSDLQIAQSRGLNPLVPETLEEYSEVLEYTFYKKPFVPWPVSSVLAEKAVRSGAFYGKVKEDLDTHQIDLLPLLSTIKIPVLVIWGDHDRIIHVSTTDILRRSLSNSHVVIIKDCGHMPELEYPEETANYYISFLKKISG